MVEEEEQIAFVLSENVPGTVTEKVGLTRDASIHVFEKLSQSSVNLNNLHFCFLISSGRCLSSFPFLPQEPELSEHQKKRMTIDEVCHRLGCKTRCLTLIRGELFAVRKVVFERRQ